MTHRGSFSEDASVEVMESRIREAPHLVVEHVRLARMLEDAGDPKGAAETLQKAHFFLPNAPAILDGMARLSNWIDTRQRPVAIAERVKPAQAADREQLTAAKAPVEKPKRALEDDLDSLIEGLGKAKLGQRSDAPVDAHGEFVDDDGLITTETLAQIYVSQNQLEEAARVYDRLAMKENDSEKAASLRQRAHNLRLKLRDSS